MRETAVERYLVKRVEALGLPCRKFTSPSRRSVFDRVVLLRRGRVIWIETKKPKKTLTEAQQREREFLQAMGHVAYVVDTKALADELIEEIKFL